MERREIACPLCSRPISTEDTVVFGHGHLSHLDCRQPQTLNPEERALLYAYCRSHTVAECAACARSYHLSELAANAREGRPSRCPRCRVDLIDSIRVHLYGCAMLPTEIRRRAQDARDIARELVERSRQLREAADVLVREAEAALEALRGALRHSPALRS